MRWTILAGLLALSCHTGAPRLDSEYSQAGSLLRAERFDEALKAAEQGLGRAVRTGEPAFVWRFRLLRVEIMLGRRLAQQAIAALDEYGGPPPGPEWDETRARGLLLRGQASYTLNRLPAAESYLTAAEAAARSEELLAEIALRQGTLLALEGRFSEAHARLGQTLDRAVRLRDPYLEALTASNIGFTFHSESRYEEAIPWYERSRALSLGLGADDSAARAEGNLGACYASLGDYDNARLHYDHAQAAFARSGDRFDQQIFLGDSGNVLRFEGRYAEASARYAQALAIARAIPSPVWAARWLNNLATDAIDLAQWDAADKYNSEALTMKRKLGDRLSEPSSIINAADIAAGRGRYDEAVALYRTVLSSQANDLSLAAHAGLAECFARTGRPGDAEAEFETAIRETDRRGTSFSRDESRLAFLSSYNFFVRRYIDFLVANHETDRALEVLESSRSLVLAQSVDRAHDYRKIAREAGAVLAEYSLGETNSYLWVIDAKRVTFHTLPSRDVLEPLVAGYHAVIVGGRNPLDVAADTGRRLYDALLAPLIQSADGATRFILVPDDILYSLNFETLPATRQAMKYWIEDATISIAPSLNYLSGARRRRAAPDRVLLVGDPVPSPAYPRLDFATREMESIATALPGWSATTLKGDLARPEGYAAVKPAQFGFIHFSAHASTNQLNPLDSAIILSGPPDRCRLTARQVLAQPLNARLVTVSACRSAGGRLYHGEGVIGLAWAFLKAGAANVIAGLWDVNDRSTMRLMSRLYAGVGAGDSIADALREARLGLIGEGGAYEKPFYWAPFQLFIGSADAMKPAPR